MKALPIGPRQRPTRRQLKELRAYIAVGSIAVAAYDSIAVAAYELGITETTPVSTSRGCTGGRAA